MPVAAISHAPMERTPFLHAHVAERRTLPGAPKVPFRRQQSGKVRRYCPPRGIVERMIDGAALWHGLADVAEECLEGDPQFPPSAVRLCDHPRGAAWCCAQVDFWHRAGFLPVAVSRLVGLCLADCARCLQCTVRMIEAEEDRSRSPYISARRAKLYPEDDEL
jgi:hypothetical protein